MKSGYRESTESWAEVLRNLRDLGLVPPLVAIGDGALGLWAALDQVFPTTEHQRCWNHRVLNVQNKLPKRLQAEARRRLREMWESETQALCEERRDDYVAELRSLGQGPAAETVLRDWEDFVTFYHYPKACPEPAEGNTGCTCGPATPSSPSSAGSGYGPPRPADALPGQCPLPGVQAGGTAQRQLEGVEWRRKPDGPGAGRSYLQGWDTSTPRGGATGASSSLTGH